MLLKFSDLHIKHPLTYFNHFFFQSKVVYTIGIHIWKQNIPNFNQLMLFFQSNPFLFQLEPIAWFYIDNIPNAHSNSGPEEQFWNWLGPVTPKQSMSKKGQNYYYTAYLQGHHRKFKPGKTTRPQIIERLCFNNRNVVVLPQNQGKTAVLPMKD